MKLACPHSVSCAVCGPNGVVTGIVLWPAEVLRRQSTIKRDDRIMWYDSMQNAIKQTIIISEILDTRTRHLIQVSFFANVPASDHAGEMCPAQ